MTATDELRRLLDERGVEHSDLGGMTEWANENRRICRAYTRPEPLTVDVAVLAVPPEQAIAATLGGGTCMNMEETDAEWFSCSECNTELRVHEPFSTFSIHYCPNCGRRVTDDRQDD